MVASLEASGTQVPFTLDIQGTEAALEQGSLLQEVEEKATDHIRALEEDHQTELKASLYAAVAEDNFAKAAELQAELLLCKDPADLTTCSHIRGSKEAKLKELHELLIAAEAVHDSTKVSELQAQLLISMDTPELNTSCTHPHDARNYGSSAPEPGNIEARTPGPGSVAPQGPKDSDVPLIDPPVLGEKIKDTEKLPYWIPGAFPTIFQNESGDPYNFIQREVDMHQWGPHVLRSRGWHAQAHMTFMYWWTNMMQRFHVLSAKKWFVRDNPEAQGYTTEDIRKMGVTKLSKKLCGYTSRLPYGPQSVN